MVEKSRALLLPILKYLLTGLSALQHELIVTLEISTYLSNRFFVKNTLLLIEFVQ